MVSSFCGVAHGRASMDAETEFNMLILGRRQEESIQIGDDIVVKVLGIKTNRVILGFQAPDGTPIHREELLRRPSSHVSAGRRTSLETGGE